jgi:virulence factor Mce-like protein
MVKSAPSFGRVAVMAAFALSCFGLLLFLWLAFGGSVPLKAEGYRFKTSFAEATQLAKEADVRISGVPVGKVKTVEPDNRSGRSEVVVELDERYAPLPSDSRAILRQKTLLGETYVELTPGSESARPVPEGGRLADAQVSPTVELDEIYRAFDPKTRQAFRTWMQTQAVAVEGRGKDLNDALGNLAPFAEDTSEILDTLNSQEGAVRRVVSNTAVVFDALTERDGQLRGLIENANGVFSTTARRDRELQELFRVLPTFSRESARTLARLERFARDTNPLVTQLRPAARELSPTLVDLQALAPDLRALFRDLDPLITASRTGFPAAQRILDDLRPLLAQTDPTLRQLNPMLEWLGLYKRELTAFFANAVASTQARPAPGEPTYLRTTNPLNPENLAVYPRRIGTNRTNPYTKPGAFRNLAKGLDSFEVRHCGRGVPTLSPTAAPSWTGSRRSRRSGRRSGRSSRPTCSSRWSSSRCRPAHRRASRRPAACRRSSPCAARRRSTRTSAKRPSPCGRPGPSSSGSSWRRAGAPCGCWPAPRCCARSAPCWPSGSSRARPPTRWWVAARRPSRRRSATASASATTRS